MKDNITTAPEYPIHDTVMEEFSESDRAESSLRHLRQVSNLLWLAEEEGLVADNTCYVELGAGKGSALILHSYKKASSLALYMLCKPLLYIEIVRINTLHTVVDNFQRHICY